MHMYIYSHIYLHFIGLVSGTMFRGQFEKLLKDLLDEVEQINRSSEQAGTERQIVLFIDEIHTIVGAGNSGLSCISIHVCII